LNGNGLGLETPAPTATSDPASLALPSAAQQPTISPAPADRDRIKPLSAKTYCVQFTMDEATHELLQQAQSLLGHRVAPGDLADVFSRALKAYVQLLERAKFAATDAPRTPNRAPHENSRHIPAHVKRTVWKRDGGQCTFVGEGSNRCEERSGLEFDHVREFARGGRATVDNIRLRCRAHNQLHAEKTFGAGFMQDKREHAIAARPLSHGSGSNSPRGEFFTGT
jgi:5-methylcytosine-specific restriction endonuclease McrA